MLNKWIAGGLRFVHEMELSDVAALKFCLISLGALVGIAIPKGGRKPIAVLSALVFLGTFAAMVFKLLVSLTSVREDG